MYSRCVGQPCRQFSWPAVAASAQRFGVDHSLSPVHPRAFTPLWVGGEKCATPFKPTLARRLADEYHRSLSLAFLSRQPALRQTTPKARAVVRLLWRQFHTLMII